MEELVEYLESDWEKEIIFECVGEPQEYGFESYEDMERYIEVALEADMTDFQRYLDELERSSSEHRDWETF